MFEITLIAMGKLKEKFYLSAAAEYEKRLKGYCSFKIIELPEVRLSDAPSAAEIANALEKKQTRSYRKSPRVRGFASLPPRGSCFLLSS